MDAVRNQPTNGAIDSALIPTSLDSTYRHVPLSQLHESPLNPRKTFDAAKLEELAASIRNLGRILHALVVRHSPWEPGKLEIVAGARRYRAAKLCRLTQIPVDIVEMTDAAVLEVMVIENSQREDVLELEEAEGFRALMAQAEMTADKLGEKVGKSKEYVYGRLKLLDGIDEVKKALAERRITAGHAILLARLQPRDQSRGLKEGCFPGWRDGCASVRELDEWLDRNVRCNLDQAPFKTEDASLLPAAGACGVCPKREDRRCHDPGCYQAKIAAFVEAKKATLAKKGDFVQISTNYSGVKAKEVLDHNRWQPVPPGQSGPDVKTALVVDGRNIGTVQQVKLVEPPKPSGSASRADHEKERAKSQAKAKQEGAVRVRILEAILDTVKAQLDREWIDLLATEFVDQTLEGEGGGILVRLHPALEIDRKGRALHWRDIKLERAKLIAQMKPQEVSRLLVAALLAEECSSEPWAQREKPERLLAAAKRCRVNVDKIRAAVEAEAKKSAAEKKLEDVGLLSKAQTPAKPKVAKAGGAR